MMTTYKMRREDEEIIATAKTLELFDKYWLDKWKEIYIDITRLLAKKYKMDFLLDFIEAYVSGMRYGKDGSSLRELYQRDEGGVCEKPHRGDYQEKC